MERLAEFVKDSKNRSLVRHMGFTMAAVGLVVGMVAVGVAITLESGVLGAIAAGMMLKSLILFPVTDINFPRRSGW